MRDTKNQNMANHQYQVLSTIFEGTPSSYPSSVSTVTASTATTMTATSSGGGAVKPSNEKLRCPRCNSTNTKFCYYNNYNLTQPRHFCKSCRRYWTKGGTLRNIPIGGGCRKHKPAATPAASLASAAARSSSFKFRNTASDEMGFEPHPGVFSPDQSPNPSAWLPFLGIGDVVYEPSGSTDRRGPVGFWYPPAHTLVDAPAVPGTEEQYKWRPRSLANYGSDYVEGQIRGAESRLIWDHNHVVPAFTFTDLLNN